METKKINLLILLLMGVFALQAQNSDPHGNEATAITGMISSGIRNDKTQGIRIK